MRLMRTLRGGIQHRLLDKFQQCLPIRFKDSPNTSIQTVITGVVCQRYGKSRGLMSPWSHKTSIGGQDL